MLKVYHIKSSSIWLRKNMWNSLLAFFFWKAWTSSSFQKFLWWKSRNYSQQFSLESFFLRSIYLQLLIIEVVYLMGVAFSLVWVVSVFFFLFYWHFFWQTLTIQRIAGVLKRMIVLFVFYFHLLTNIHLVHRNFYHFFLANLFLITRLIADETSSPQSFAFYFYFYWCN